MKKLWISVAVFLFTLACIYAIGWYLPVKHTATLKRSIPAPKAEIWSMVTKPERYPDWRSTVERVQIHSDSSEMLHWTEYYSEQESLGYEEVERRDSSLFISKIVDQELPFGGSWTIRLESIGSNTLIEITEDGEIYNPVFRFFARFILGYEATMDTYLNDLEGVFREG